MYDITDEQWGLIEPILAEITPNDKKYGRPPCDFQEVFKGIIWVLRSGARWKDLPQKYPSYQTCHRRFQQWVRLGAIQTIFAKIVNQFELDMSETYIDASFAHAKKGGKKVGKCLKGKGSKWLAIIEKQCIPISICLYSASPHEASLAEDTIKNRQIRARLRLILGDKAYDSNPLDKRLKKKGINMIAPNRNFRKTQRQDGRPLRRMKRRWTIERYFAWLKSYRRLVIRWERKPENFEAMVLIAAICLLLRDF